jgi:hypothetical protein
VLLDGRLRDKEVVGPCCYVFWFASKAAAWYRQTLDQCSRQQLRQQEIRQNYSKVHQRQGSYYRKEQQQQHKETTAGATAAGDYIRKISTGDNKKVIRSPGMERPAPFSFGTRALLD